MRISNSKDLTQNQLLQLQNLWTNFNGTTVPFDIFFKEIKKIKYILLTAIDNTDILGFALIEVVQSPLRLSSFVEVVALYVGSSKRKLGIGSLLHATIEENTARLSCSDIHLNAKIDSTALSFYIKNEYKTYAYRMRKEVT